MSLSLTIYDVTCIWFGRNTIGNHVFYNNYDRKTQCIVFQAVAQRWKGAELRHFSPNVRSTRIQLR